MGKFRRKTRYYGRFRPERLFKECQFCKEDGSPDYKNIDQLSQYLQQAGKISSRKVNGNCAKHQRKLATAIKRARFLALLLFAQKV